ncbi:choline kinase [Natronospira proteinivora]|uniref:Choline kinase n=1 Tax=Natronospira proteinivora TaxID=1807133 RepID=A0ABT1G9A0_9GAMM|nr:PEP/pyruvate-binding domain-containing protein [Natronospira proteinivora]MCP1727896.1 choline kinase [Natronospira proteinivora]
MAGVKRVPSEHNDSPKLVVLGAGRPFRGQQHTALRGTTGEGRVLDWLLQAVSDLKPEIHFVGGYQVEEVARRYPDFHYVVNPEWEETGAAASLLEAALSGVVDHYVSYADILFHDSVVREMRQVDADIVVGADTHWRKRFEGRTEEDIARCEKLNLHEGTVTRLGADIDPEFADAEFIGLVRFSPRVVAFLKDQARTLAGRMRRAKLSQLVEFLRTRGFSVRAVDVAGDWAELNESRDLAHFVLGTKAQTLYRLQGLVKKSRIEDQVTFTVAQWQADTTEVIRRVAAAFDGKPLVVRSSALSEDGFSSANAGAYTSVLHVDSSDAVALRQAIEEVVASYPDGNPANQVLVQPMVADVRASGVAFTRTLAYGAPYYVINYDDVTRSTESITSGASKEHKTLVIYRGAELDPERIPESVRGLPAALREIERLLEYDSLDIEFAISSAGEVHILQVRPIAVDHEQWEVSDGDVAALIETGRNRFQALQTPSPFTVGRRAFFGVMPDWNPAEIIGTKPGRLAMGLYRYLIMDEVWATQRAEYGYRDVRPHPLLVAFAGHPYVDIRASFNSFVPAKLDDELAGRLVDFYLEWLEANPHLHDKVEFDVVPTCYGLNFERWERRLVDEGGFSSEEVAQLRDALKGITRDALGRNAHDLASVDTLESRFDRIMAADIPALERVVVLLEDCQRYGTLAFSHLARSAFVAVTLLKTAVETEVMDKAAMDAFLNSIRTVTHRFTHDAAATAEGEMSWEAFVARYGHLRPGTYDITSPSYLEDPEHYLRPIVERAKGQMPEQADTSAWDAARSAFGKAVSEVGLSDDIDAVERFMREAIEGREYAKFVFTRNLSAALDCLAEFGESHGLDREEISNVPLDAFFGLRTGSVVTSDIAQWLKDRAYAGHRLRHMASVIELPPLLLDAGDFDVFMYPGNQPNFIGGGRITADCVDLAETGSREAPKLSGKIAMIPQADPGYDWLFGQGIAGLITMYGGANSHMAIRAAEFGLPAAIGVGETKYAQLSGAQVLELDAGNRKIQVLR